MMVCMFERLWAVLTFNNKSTIDNIDIKSIIQKDANENSIFILSIYIGIVLTGLTLNIILIARRHDPGWKNCRIAKTLEDFYKRTRFSRFSVGTKYCIGLKNGDTVIWRIQDRMKCKTLKNADGSCV